MVMRLALISAMTAMLAGAGSPSENSDPCKVVPAQRVGIDELKAAPAGYEKVRLSIAGVLESGHLGVLLGSPTGGRQDRIGERIVNQAPAPVMTV